ncbi:MAG: PhzF family phenazine biosynthesis protein [Bacteroidota bacterium]|nr:PhzF family phenazine biosynthesis protein [Bacteroidota bacterium]
MTTYPLYQVDAFTDTIFGGNPAAVCPLEAWLPTETMQQLAMENNLSETAFYVQQGDIFHIRWFTPELEIDLAGHPTLATAYIIFNHSAYSKDTIHFESKSGPLIVTKKATGLMEMNFPSRMPNVVHHPPMALLEGINHKPQHILKARDYVLVYDTEEEVRNFVADFEWLNKVDTLGIIVTAKGNECDFVSRFFVPNSVIGEDPVTGSAHAELIPYWSKVLNKSAMIARQLSKRGGLLFCEDQGNRVTISGNAVLYMKGEYFL